MAFANVGTKETQYITYDSGIVTFDGDQLIDITDITLSQSFARKSFRALNSRLERALRRGEYEGSASFTAHNASPALFAAFYGDSTVQSATETDFSIKDANQEAKTCIMTAYYNEDTSIGEQFTLETPVILSINKSKSTDSFASYEIELAFTRVSNFKRIVSS